MEEVFADQNDIHEDTRMQLELINQTLAELHYLITFLVGFLNGITFQMLGTTKVIKIFFIFLSGLQIALLTYAPEEPEVPQLSPRKRGVISFFVKS